MDRGKHQSIEKKSYGFVKLMYVHRSFILTQPNSLIQMSATLISRLKKLHFSRNKSVQVKFQRNIVDNKF